MDPDGATLPMSGAAQSAVARRAGSGAGPVLVAAMAVGGGRRARAACVRRVEVTGGSMAPDPARGGPPARGGAAVAHRSAGAR